MRGEDKGGPGDNPMLQASATRAGDALLAGAGAGFGGYGSSQTGDTALDVSANPSARTSKPCKERIFGKLPSERAPRVWILAFLLLEVGFLAASFAQTKGSHSDPAGLLAETLKAQHAAMPMVLGSLGLGLVLAAAAARNVLNFKRQTKVIRNSRRTTPVSKKITTAVSSCCAYLWCMEWFKYPDQKLVVGSVLALASSVVGLMNIPSHGVMSGSATGSYFWDAVMGASLVAATLATLAAWAAARAVAPVASASTGAAADHLASSGNLSDGGGSGLTDGVPKVPLSRSGVGAPSPWPEARVVGAPSTNRAQGRGGRAATLLADPHLDPTGAEAPGLPGSVDGKPNQTPKGMPEMAHETPGALRVASTRTPAGKKDGAALAGGLGNRSEGRRYGAMAAAVLVAPGQAPGQAPDKAPGQAPGQ